MFGIYILWKNVNLNYKKEYKKEGPLNYFEKMLTYGFKNSTKVNSLGTFFKSNHEEAN